MPDNPNRLLIIDDEPGICDFIAEVGEDMGFDVTIAETPAQFEAAVDEFVPTVIVLDLQMPDVDGVELIRLLGEKDCEAHVIVASGMDSRVLATAEQLGTSQGLKMLEALPKPIMLNDLEAAFKQAMAAQRNITERDVQRAMDEEQLVMHYQPKVGRQEPGVWRIEGAEALVRWEHPEFGLVMPDEFVPIVEQSNLITSFSSYVFRATLRQAAVWMKEGFQPVVGVNLSAQLLTDLSLPDRVGALVKEYAVAPENLILELTETAAMSDPGKTMDILTRVRVKNIGLAIDDFGTGYSSLSQLYRMPFNELKIAGSFVKDVCNNEEARTMVDSMIYLAHKLKMSACAEGVEDSETLEVLDEFGCDRAQGFFIGEAVTADEFVDTTKRWNKRTA